MRPSQFITSSIDPGQSVSYELIIEELNVGLSNFKIWVSTSNVSKDAYTRDDTLQWSTTLSNLEVDLPIKLDFEKRDDWIITIQEDKPSWQPASFQNNNYLMASGYENTDLGNESWLISPLLYSGYLDSMSLQFDFAYQRIMGKNDRLRVLISTDCGENFDHVIFDKNSEQLSDVISNENFLIKTNSVWRMHSLILIIF